MVVAVEKSWWNWLASKGLKPGFSGHSFLEQVDALLLNYVPAGYSARWAALYRCYFRMEKSIRVVLLYVPLNTPAE